MIARKEKITQLSKRAPDTFYLNHIIVTAMILVKRKKVIQ